MGVFTFKRSWCKVNGGTVKMFTTSNPPWQPPHKVFNLGTEKGKAKRKVIETLDSLTSKDIVIFTNGSDIPNKGKGAAAVIEKEKIIISNHIPLTTKISNFETELVGIILTIEAARRAIAIQSIKGKETNNKYIFSDNQGALLKSAHPFKPSTAQYLYLKIFHDINSLQILAPIQLWWCSGHVGITGNELANTEAKNSALDSTQTTFKLKHSLVKLSQETKKATNKNELTEEETQRTKNLKSKPQILITALNKLEKAKSSILHQLRSEHVGLNKHLKRICLRGDPLCKTCNRPESVNHFMTHCRRYKAQRKRMKDKLRKKKIIFWETSMSRLLDVPKALEMIIKYVDETS
ncbi:hypothetical protein O181_081599 [Austropuccinia psidii MF-1]|uniref:RNase H type-1 domain-containing protein n=1 Tax=Austropuccinia psidii MF-1 TaxID=1389203 RepID=A0A9Q3IK98_9BASI|nr:hypothetical protein [Austropuccinia psidii MF-1]